MAKFYRLTPQADSDIADILEYTRQKWGLAQASKYLQELEQHLIDLGQKKKTGKLCSILLPTTEEIYYFHANKHYVIFRYSEYGIDVLALYHDRMDLPFHLKKLQEEGS